MLPVIMVIASVSAVTLKVALLPVLMDAFWLTESPIIVIVPLLLVIVPLRLTVPVLAVTSMAPVSVVKMPICMVCKAV